MKNKAFILLIILPLILLMCIVAAIFFAYQNANMHNMRISIASRHAFWLAEAGVTRALYELRQNFSWSGISQTNLGSDGGNYSVETPVVIDSSALRVVSNGVMPSGLSIGNIERKIEVIIKNPTPSNFFGNAIYGPKVDLNGSYDVTGNIVYSDLLDPNPPGEQGSGVFTGNVTQDPSANPLPRLNFQQLKNIAMSQIRPGGADNYFSESELGSNPDFPTSFWYDEENSIPNVVYIEGDLALNGNIGTIGGFFVVVGDVLTDPDDTGSTDINGNGTVEGCIYTTADFDINGGGQSLNVNGGVWAGNEADLNGNATLTYNSTYQDAIRDLNIGYLPEIDQWKEIP